MGYKTFTEPFGADSLRIVYRDQAQSFVGADIARTLKVRNIATLMNKVPGLYERLPIATHTGRDRMMLVFSKRAVRQLAKLYENTGLEVFLDHVPRRTITLCWVEPRREKRQKHPICEIEGCHRTVHGQGLCNAHYHRLKAHGDAEKPGTMLRPQCRCGSCERSADDSGYCSFHSGRPPIVPLNRPIKECRLCAHKHYAKSLCKTHYTTQFYRSKAAS